MKARQFGVGIPGGCEGLIHFRTAFEECMKRDGGSALAVLDLDLRNAFPSFEWEQIRSAVGEHTPDIADWTRWCHAEENFVILPCGRVIWSNRGAEQGDPLGSLHCGLVLNI